MPDGFVQHDLRHYRVTKWMAEGKGSALVKEAAGHASITTTEGYTHLVKEDWGEFLVFLGPPSSEDEPKGS